MSDSRATTDLTVDLDDGVDGGAQLEVIVPALGALVSQVRPIDLSLSTPCRGWTVRDLLNHLIGGANMYADAFGGAPVLDISGRLPDAFDEGDPASAFVAAATRFGEAAGAPGAQGQILELPWGATTVANFLRFAAFDLLVHCWDLATALGAEFEIPDGIVLEVEAFAHTSLDGWVRDDVNFSAEQTLNQGGTPMERLLAYSGRRVPQTTSG